MFIGGLVGLTGVAALTSLPFLLVLFPNVSSTRVVDESYAIGPYQLREEIYRYGNDWPDQRYRRIYTIQQGQQSIPLGQFEGEDPSGIVTEIAPPKIVAQWLVVFSASQVLLWQAERPAITFTPYDAEGWDGYAEQKFPRINGHSDYDAVDFSIEGDRWLLTYRCASQPCRLLDNNQPMPAQIIFFSDDQGQTFHILEHQQ